MVSIPDGWESIELNNLLRYEQPTNYLVKNKNYNNIFNVPVLTAGKTFILGYTNENNGIFKDNLPVIIFDDFTTSSQFVDFNFKVKSSAMKILKLRNDSTNIKLIFELMQKLNFTPEEHKRHWISVYSKLKVNFPKSKKEQEKIAEILSEVDDAIQKAEAYHEKNQKIKIALMQDLLTHGIDENGKIRNQKTHEYKSSPLGDIPIGWKSKTVKSICKVRQGLQISIKQRYSEYSKNRYEYITVKYLNKKNSTAEYIENPDTDLICKQDDILFTRTGNTGQIITNVYGVFHNNFFRVDYYKDKIDKDYFIYYLNQEIIQNKIMDLAGTTTIPDLKHSDFYSLPIIYPENIKEQQKISQILSSQDEKIEKAKAKIEKLKSLKTALMQDLLSGTKRVNHLLGEVI